MYNLLYIIYTIVTYLIYVNRCASVYSIYRPAQIESAFRAPICIYAPTTNTLNDHKLHIP